MLSVQKLPLSKMIQVHDIGKLSEENIMLYFESPRYGGGPIAHCKCWMDKGHAIVEFEEVEGMQILFDF